MKSPEIVAVGGLLDRTGRVLLDTLVAARQKRSCPRRRRDGITQRQGWLTPLHLAELYPRLKRCLRSCCSGGIRLGAAGAGLLPRGHAPLLIRLAGHPPAQIWANR